MIEINLLPEEYRAKKSVFQKIDLSGIDFKKVPVAKIATMSLAALVLFHMLLFLTGISSRAYLGILTRKYEKLLPQKREADALRDESEYITKKVKTIDGLMVKRFSWARKLNSLSDSLTPGVWLSELYYDETVTEKAAVRYLVLSGYASKMGEEGTALVGRFIQSLKDNREFYSDFSAIELGSIKSDKWDDQEIMRFTITCFFR